MKLSIWELLALYSDDNKRLIMNEETNACKLQLINGLFKWKHFCLAIYDDNMDKDSNKKKR